MCALGLGKSMDVAAGNILSKSVNTGSYSPKASEALARLMTEISVSWMVYRAMRMKVLLGAVCSSETHGKPFATVLG